MGLSQSKQNTETLDWDKINTDSFSSNLPSLKDINKDTKQLIEKLNITDNINYEDTESENSNIFSWLATSNMDPKDAVELNKISNLINGTNIEPKNIIKIENNDKNDPINSETSPFISSEQYENLMNEKTSDTEVPNTNTQKGGAIAETSSSSLGSVTKLSRRSTVGTEGSDLSYISSSAHSEDRKNMFDQGDSNESSELLSIDSEGLNSSQLQTINQTEASNLSSQIKTLNSSNKSSEYQETTITAENNNPMSSEIKTSDINLISSD